MKDSEVEWIGDIPNNWVVKRLKYVSKSELSSIDRHIKNEEIEVFVCHYPDVYNNDLIQSSTILNVGTCTLTEFKKFQLKKDDVLITKDSETPDDIGVPAYVKDDLEKTVCGYHLCQISTNKTQLTGEYLFRFIQTDRIRGYFEANSNGVTRYGLGKSSIENLFVPIPSLSEQKQITDFLDKKTSKIDSEIQKNKKLISLLQEKYHVVINQAVTKGLDSTIQMKDSGIEWVGKIPNHWNLSKIRFVTSFIRSGISRALSLEDLGYPVLRSSNVQEGKLDMTKVKYWHKKDTQGVNLSEYILDENDVILNFINSLEQIGKACLFVKQERDWIYTTNLFKIKTVISKMLPKYFVYVLNSMLLHEQIKSITQPAVNQASFTKDDFKQLLIVYPDTGEQKQITDFLDTVTNKINKLINITENQINKLEEFRQSLISAAVTGKIDVR